MQSQLQFWAPALAQTTEDAFTNSPSPLSTDSLFWENKLKTAPSTEFNLDQTANARMAKNVKDTYFPCYVKVFEFRLPSFYWWNPSNVSDEDFRTRDLPSAWEVLSAQTHAKIPTQLSKTQWKERIHIVTSARESLVTRHMCTWSWLLRVRLGTEDFTYHL